MAAAKKEGKVTVYNWTLSTWMDPWVKESFKAAYGIEVETIRVSGAILSERLKSEYRAGVYKADVWNSAHAYTAHVDQQGLLLPALGKLPVFRDVTDANVWYYNPLWSSNVAFAAAMYRGNSNYTVNTKVVPPEREPKKWPDLLDPYWKQKICATDPVTSVIPDMIVWRSFRAQGYPDSWPGLFYDIYNRKDARIVYQMVGGTAPINTGECGFNINLIAVPAATRKVNETEEKITWLKGASFDPAEPTQPTHDHSSGLVKNAPHSNAAMLFLNWWYSKEGQTSMVNYKGQAMSMRRDVPDAVEAKYFPEKPVTAFWTAEPDWFLFENYAFATRLQFRMMKEGMSKDAWLKEFKDTSLSYWGKFPPAPAVIYAMDEPKPTK